VSEPRRFPFSAVVGLDDARLALLLAAIDPGIGGVLLRGDKGSGKSTLARGLAGLLPPGAPFVELPVGATEDRVVGALDVGAALGQGQVWLRPGLLAAAHGGVLYVDEVNLLPDHLVDVLLDAAASGVHRVERDGISHEHPARFVLVGSMNPEEGELRPQLLDRFGLAAEVRAPAEPGQRAEVVTRRLAFEAGANVAGNDDAALAIRLAGARSAGLPEDVVGFATRLALAVGAEGLRADLVLCRAAAALAGWEGRAEATVADVERVAALALAHRRRRRPFDPPALSQAELEQALEQAQGRAPGGPATGEEHPESDLGQSAASSSDRVDSRWGDMAPGVLSAPAPPAYLAPGGPAAVSPALGPHVRGPVIRERRAGPEGPAAVAVAGTLRAGMARRTADPGGPVVAPEDLREPVRRRPPTRCLVLTVDTSGSMGSQARVEAAAGATLALLADAYRSRSQVALVAFRGQGAEVVLPPTASVEVARARLADLATGGATPLAEGLTAALEVGRRAVTAGNDALIVVLTDGRATAGPAALERAFAAAGDIAAAGIRSVVLDAEQGPTRLGLAFRLAAALQGPWLPLAELSAGAVEAAIRTTLEPAP
jgi:magnesium chelatase subunit D